MSQNLFANYGSAFAITPSDTTIITCRAVYVGMTGTVAIKTTGSAPAVAFLAVAAGTVLPVSIENGQIMATGTTATGIVALA